MLVAAEWPGLGSREPRSAFGGFRSDQSRGQTWLAVGTCWLDQSFRQEATEVEVR
jgi:hypothetical protein